MTNKLMPNSLHFFFTFFLPCFLLFTSCYGRVNSSIANGMFVFGSSLVDNGNNNFINSASGAKYKPYGIDFPLGPTGRYTNGKNIIDALGGFLKLPLIPAFLNPATKGRNIVQGVDFASGGSGILDDTGASRHVISLNQQIRNFEDVTLPELKTQLGSSASLSNYLFVLGTGGNDLLYFLPSFNSTPGLQDFTANLTRTLSTQIQKLYSLGARKFVLISVYPIGCIPFFKNIYPTNQSCIDTLNQLAVSLNAQMKFLVDDLKPKLLGSALVYVNSYKVILDIVEDPAAKGFNVANSSCCEVLLLNQTGSGIACKRHGSVCDDRRGHVFFDGLHPTEAVNDIIAKKAFTSKLQAEVYPINVQQLAELQVESELT